MNIHIAQQSDILFVTYVIQYLCKMVYVTKPVGITNLYDPLLLWVKMTYIILVIGGKSRVGKNWAWCAHEYIEWWQWHADQTSRGIRSDAGCLYAAASEWGKYAIVLLLLYYYMIIMLCKIGSQLWIYYSDTICPFYSYRVFIVVQPPGRLVRSKFSKN